MINSELIKSFFDNLNKLGKNDLANLKIAYGKSYKNSSMKSLISFYKVLPESVKHDIYIYFFIATLYSKQKDMNFPKKKLVEIIKLENNNDSSSIMKKFQVLLRKDYKLNEDSTLLYSLMQLIRMINSNGYCVDEKDLIYDLIYWDYREVSKDWARKVYSI